MYSLSSSDVQKYGGIAKIDVVKYAVKVDDDLQRLQDRYLAYTMICIYN